MISSPQQLVNDRSHSASPQIPVLHRATDTSRSATPTTFPRWNKDKRVEMLKNEDRSFSADSLKSSTLSLTSVHSFSENDEQDSDCDDTKRLVSLDLYILQGRKGFSQFHQHLNVLLEDTLMVGGFTIPGNIYCFVFKCAPIAFIGHFSTSSTSCI